MNDEFRDRIKAALTAGIEPPAPGLADRAFAGIATGVVVAPSLGGALHIIWAWLARHWPWLGGVGAAIAAAVVILASQTPAVSLYVGYADSRPAAAGQQAAFPSPWKDAAGTDFVGTGPRWDAGALRLQNRSGRELVIDRVSVDIGTHHYELWGSGLRLAAGHQLILTQTSVIQPDPLQTNFDTSEALSDVCSAPSSVVPVVHLVIEGHRMDFKDKSLILTTGGRDSGNCPGKPTESHPWQELNRS